MIEITGLTKTYADGHCALNGVDLRIEEGMLGLLGPNGAGKTTFLSILVLALEPTSGRRIYVDLDAARASARSRIRAMIGYLPQDFSPIGHLSGHEYLVHCARIRNVPMSLVKIKARAELLLDAVYLTDAAQRRSRDYSGGMKRRLGIAQALIHTPRLVVVDEPTAGLDPEERIRFRNLITEIADETAVLLSTHVVEDIEATCQRIAVIARGRVLFDDTPSALISWALGKIWKRPASAVGSDHATLLGQRVEEGQQIDILYSLTAVGESAHDGLTLEDAYAAFLAGHGYFGDALQ